MTIDLDLDELIEPLYRQMKQREALEDIFDAIHGEPPRHYDPIAYMVENVRGWHPDLDEDGVRRIAQLTIDLQIRDD